MDNKVFNTFSRICEHLCIVTIEPEDAYPWEEWHCYHPVNRTPEVLAMDQGFPVDCMYVFCPLIDPDTRKDSIK